MESSKLISILRSLNSDELKRFGEFIESPYFNKQAALKKVFHILKKFHPDFKKKTFKKEIIYHLLYPGEKFNDLRLRILFSRLLNLAKEFLAYENYKGDVFSFNRHLLKEIREKQLHPLFTKFYENVLTLLNKQCKDESYFFNKYLIDSEMYLYDLSKTQLGKRSGLYKKIYTDNVKLLFNSFFIRLFKTYCQGLNNKNCVDFTLDTKPQKLLLDAIDTYFDKDTLYINIYSKILKLDIGINKEDNAKDILEILINYSDEIDPYDRINISMQLRNYYTDLINLENKPGYYLDAHKLDKEILKNPCCMINNGYLPVPHYMSIIDYGLTVNDLEWTKNFMYEYKNKINPDVRKEIFMFCEARYYFYIKKYFEALKILSRISYTDSELYFNINNLKIKIFYELKYKEDIKQIIDTTKHYFHNNPNIGNSASKLLLPFYKIVLKLCNIKKNTDPMVLEKLRNEIMNTKTIAGRFWLLEKINELFD